MPHPEVQYLGKGLKQFMITTGIGIAYMNDFVVSIHNIQKPSKEAIIHDFTHDYFIKVITQRRVNAKKAAKQEKSLANLIKTVRDKKSENKENVKTPEELL